MINLPPSYVFELLTPPDILVQVFTSLQPSVKGHLKLDNNTISCVNPWTTAMKYMDHMNSRGWETLRVDQYKLKRCTTVTLTMKRKLDGLTSKVLH